MYSMILVVNSFVIFHNTFSIAVDELNAYSLELIAEALMMEHTVIDVPVDRGDAQVPRHNSPTTNPAHSRAAGPAWPWLPPQGRPEPAPCKQPPRADFRIRRGCAAGGMRTGVAGGDGRAVGGTAIRGQGAFQALSEILAAVSSET